MSDEDCLFGKYLDAGYWNELFENEGLDGVQKQLRTLQELPDKIEGLCDPIEELFDASELKEQDFIDGVQSGSIQYCDYAEDPAAYAEDELFQLGMDAVNNFPYNMFFEYEDFGEWLIQNDINQGILVEVNGNYYEID